MDWQSASYERSTKHPEKLNIKTISGNMVRSKSEALIDMVLFMSKIPFRYECELILDNTRYARKVYSKLEQYNSHAIISSVNLITTFETKAHPLNADLIEKIVQYYFK